GGGRDAAHRLIHTIRHRQPYDDVLSLHDAAGATWRHRGINPDCMWQTVRGKVAISAISAIMLLRASFRDLCGVLISPRRRALRRSVSEAHRRGFSRQRINFRFWPEGEEDVERSASSTLSSHHTKASMIWLSESDREMEM